MQGMPSAVASLARSPIRSTDQRDTPGKVAIGSSTPSPSQTNSGQIRSDGVSTVSATSARLHAAARVRRILRTGKEAGDIAGHRLARVSLLRKEDRSRPWDVLLRKREPGPAARLGSCFRRNTNPSYPAGLIRPPGSVSPIASSSSSARGGMWRRMFFQPP